MEQQDNHIKQLLKIVEDQHVQLDRQHNQIMELEDKVQEPSLFLFSEFVISCDTEGVNGPSIPLGQPPLLLSLGVQRRV